MYLKYIIIGLVTGVLSSLLGIGGGVLLIPLLVFIMHHHMKDAIAISLATVVPITVVSAILHFFVNHESIYLTGVVFVVLFALIGSYAGVHIVHKLSQDRLLKIFSLFVVLIAVKMFFGLSIPVHYEATWYVFAIIGFCVGLISGFFGISGGVILVPLLESFANLPLSIAVSTSAMCVVPIVAAGAWMHHSKKKFDLHIFYTLIPAALIGVFLGISLGVILVDGYKEIIFGAVLLFVAVKLYFRKDKHTTA